MGDSYDFERGQIVGVRLVGASVTKNCHIIRCIESYSSEGYVSIHESWQDNITEKEHWVKINIDRMHRRILRIISKNHRTTTAQVTAELNIHLEATVSTKTVRRELHKSNIHGRTAVAKPLITESNVQMPKWWCYDHQTWR
jgi:hypothetical protein